jgi:hypothetical protein
MQPRIAPPDRGGAPRDKTRRHDDSPQTAGAFRVCEREIPAVLSTAHALAEAARRETLRHFRSNTLETDEQGRTRRCLLRPGDHRRPRRRGRDARGSGRAQTAGRHPRRRSGRRARQSGLTWVLDPIDGTRGFIAGTPTWGVLIALCDAEGPIYGIIDQPYIGERFEGGLGRARLTGPRGARPCPSRPPPRWPRRRFSPPSPRSAPRRNARGSRRCATRCADPLRAWIATPTR